ncbi:MAG: hypothetical protein AAFZ15_16370 [Bacteroidota bacterium]
MSKSISTGRQNLPLLFIDFPPTWKLAHSPISTFAHFDSCPLAKGKITGCGWNKGKEEMNYL